MPTESSASLPAPRRSDRAHQSRSRPRSRSWSATTPRTFTAPHCPSTADSQPSSRSNSIRSGTKMSARIMNDERKAQKGLARYVRTTDRRDGKSQGALYADDAIVEIFIKTSHDAYQPIGE